MVVTKYVLYLYSDNNNEAVIVKLKIMKTIKMYTSENVTANSGKIFNIYKGDNNVGEVVYTIRDEEKNELGYRKSKKAIENFLAKN